MKLNERKEEIPQRTEKSIERGAIIRSLVGLLYTEEY